MGTSQPIRDLEKLRELKDYYRTKKPNPRNYTMICLGINSALRISDLLHLKWGDVYDFALDRFHYHIIIAERKTGKETRIAINQSAWKALALYKEAWEKNQEISAKMYLFPGRNGCKKPLSRSQAFRIIRRASEELHMEKGISCHSMRKTFGYHAWKNGTQPALLTDIYNHSSYQITRRYLGIDQEDKDAVFFQINL